MKQQTDKVTKTLITLYCLSLTEPVNASIDKHPQMPAGQHNRVIGHAKEHFPR